MELRSLDLLPRSNSWEVSVIMWGLFNLGGGGSLEGALKKGFMGQLVEGPDGTETNRQGKARFSPSASEVFSIKFVTVRLV